MQISQNELLKIHVRKERQKIMTCNLPNYDLSCASYLREIEIRPFEVDELIMNLYAAIEHYQNYKSYKVPPRLCRLIGETAEQYLERTYGVAGYECL